MLLLSLRFDKEKIKVLQLSNNKPKSVFCKSPFKLCQPVLDILITALTTVILGRMINEQ